VLEAWGLRVRMHAHTFAFACMIKCPLWYTKAYMHMPVRSYILIMCTSMLVHKKYTRTDASSPTRASLYLQT